LQQYTLQTAHPSCKNISAFVFQTFVKQMDQTKIKIKN